MQYHPAPELTANSYMNLRRDIHAVVADWISREGIKKTAEVRSLRFFGSRVLVKHENGTQFFLPTRSIPFGSNANLAKALSLKPKSPF